MKKHKESHISDVIKQMLKRYRIDTQFQEMDIEAKWEEIVGPMIAKHTTSIELKNKTLYVHFDNPTLKNEVFLQKSALLGKVNEYFERVVAEKIFIGS